MTDIPGTLIIDEMVGSQAYGLATEESDIDRLGVYVTPTRHLVGIMPGWAQTVVGKDDQGDYAYHELGKAVRLWLACNPTVTELLWLPTVNNSHDYPGERYSGDEWQSRRAPWSSGMIKGIVAYDLRSLRNDFLSTAAVVNAYGGYAKQQAMKLDRRQAEGKPGFSSKTIHRTAKNARHCMRLLIQGEQLLTEGRLDVDCTKDRDYLFRMGELAENDVDDFMVHWQERDNFFKMSARESILPTKANREAINDFLVTVRKECWDESHLQRTRGVQGTHHRFRHRRQARRTPGGFHGPGGYRQLLDRQRS